MDRVGFIGTGAITEAVVTGFCRLPIPPSRITVSPRNAERARLLSESFERVTVAPDNQSVVDASDVVCLAVLPDIAPGILGELQFRAGQQIVSFLATLSLDELREFIAPANQVCRMVPLPPVADHLGPIALCPSNDRVAKLFGGLGTLTAVGDEEQLRVLWTTTAMMAPFFGLLNAMTAWLEARDIEPQEARRYVGSMIHALSVTGKQVGDGGFAQLIVDHSTPRGLNEQALRELDRAGWCALVPRALSLIEDRLAGRADFDSRIE